jgi:hypothetical protein
MRPIRPPPSAAGRPGIGPIELVPQDITRLFPKLFTNGF